MLKVIMLKVVMLSVIMLSVVMLSVIMLSVVMLSVVMLSVVAPTTKLPLLANFSVLFCPGWVANPGFFFLSSFIFLSFCC